MNTRKSKNSIQLMKEFTSADLFNFNNNPEISSFEPNKGLIEFKNKDNKMQKIDIKEYLKIKSSYFDIRYDQGKYIKKDNFPLASKNIESTKDLKIDNLKIKKELPKNNNLENSSNIKRTKTIKYKLKESTLTSEKNIKNEPKTEKIKRPFDKEINLIYNKRNFLLKQNEMNNYLINFYEIIIKKYKKDPSNYNNNTNIINLVNDMNYKIYKNEELCLFGNDGIKIDINNNNKFREKEYKQDLEYLLNKVKFLEKKILTVFNTKFNVDLTGNELKINLNGKKIGDLDLSLLFSVYFQYIEEIDLSNNNISNLNEINGWNFPNLKVLKMGHNKIKNIEPLKKLPSLNIKKIDLSYNIIENVKPLEDVMKKNNKLEKINLKNNLIENIETLKKNITSNIKEINLQNNKILEKECKEIENIIQNNITKIEEVKKTTKFLIYKKKSCDSEIRLFNKIFVEKNKEKCKLIINNQELDLIEFYNLKADEKILKVALIVFENLIDMSYMFCECTSLISLDGISDLNTENVTNMSYMFYHCSSLESLDGISDLNTEKVTNMSSMFYQCSSLSTLDGISNWKTENVIDMSYMFYECSSL